MLGSRGMAAVLAIAAISLTASTAGAQINPDNFEQVMSTFGTLSGRCEKFAVRDGDLTAGCRPVLASNNSGTDRVSFHFFFEDGAIATISGRDQPNPTPDTDVMAVDRFTVHLGAGVPPASGPANGECSYGNPNTGPMTIRCVGTQEGAGEFEAVFTTDGNPASFMDDSEDLSADGPPQPVASAEEQCENMVPDVLALSKENRDGMTGVYLVGLVEIEALELAPDRIECTGLGLWSNATRSRIKYLAYREFDRWWLEYGRLN